jgi:DNA-binding MarR family transcriptional regulator
MTDSIDRFFSEWAVQMEKAGLPGVPQDTQYIYRMARVCKILGDRLDATCARHDLTRSQFEAMAVLRRRHPEPLSAGDLMKAAFLTSGSVTAMLNQLLGKDLVQRQPHKEDRRRIEVQLTPEGIKKIEAVIAERIQDNVALAHLLPEKPREEINHLMRHFLAAAEALEGTPK